MEGIIGLLAILGVLALLVLLGQFLKNLGEAKLVRAEMDTDPDTRLRQDNRIRFWASLSDEEVKEALIASKKGHAAFSEWHKKHNQKIREASLEESV